MKKRNEVAMEKSEILKALVVTIELCGGSELSQEALEVFVEDLSEYQDKEVMKALLRCRKEVRGRFSMADVISRITSPWPTADEAWALCPKGETESVVWFDECAFAYGATENLATDQVARRMAFKDAYERELAQTDRKKPKWWSSLGTDKQHRARAIEDAISRGRLSEKSRALLPPAQEENKPVKQLESTVGKGPSVSQVSSLRELLGAGLSSEELKERVQEIMGQQNGDESPEPPESILTPSSDDAPKDEDRGEKTEHSAVQETLP